MITNVITGIKNGQIYYYAFIGDELVGMYATAAEAWHGEEIGVTTTQKEAA